MLIHHLENNESLNEHYKNEIIELIHFIRTPLSSIKIGGEILKDIFPILIEAYKANIQPNDRNGAILSGDKLNKLKSIIEGLILEANRISEYIQQIKIK